MNQHINATIEKEIVCKYFCTRIDENNNSNSIKIIACLPENLFIQKNL